MSETTLLPCPFCGTQPELTRHGNEFTKKRHVEITCRKCNIKHVTGAIRYSLGWCESYASKVWNNRTPPEIKTPPTEPIADYKADHASMNC